TVARVRELETIRNFLTGQGLTSALDLLFTILFIVVLFIYSTTLATVVIVSLPFYALVATLIRPALREKVKERFNRSAINNQFLGAKAVINGELTVGAFVAFNMIMNQVTAPILRLSQLWQDFQQVKISVDRLGDVLNHPTEGRPLAQANLPPAKGAMQVKDVV